MRLNKFKILIKVGIVILGGVFGYLYYYFIGCSSGSCPITSNPLASITYGAVFGLVFALPNKKKKKIE